MPTTVKYKTGCELKNKIMSYDENRISDQIDGGLYEQKQLHLSDVSGSFSAEDMIKAFNAGGNHIYECEANGKDKKCYCRNDNECSHRHYISAEEWLKKYR